ncbi:MAG TPA: hypothetical protein GXX18_18265 [Bacillales bacterium]|nr:hypothetical protein [Bacillales bacterium]
MKRIILLGVLVVIGLLGYYGYTIYNQQNKDHLSLRIDEDGIRGSINYRNSTNKLGDKINDFLDKSDDEKEDGISIDAKGDYLSEVESVMDKATDTFNRLTEEKQRRDYEKRMKEENEKVLTPEEQEKIDKAVENQLKPTFVIEGENQTNDSIKEENNETDLKLLNDSRLRTKAEIGKWGNNSLIPDSVYENEVSKLISKLKQAEESYKEKWGEYAPGMGDYNKYLKRQ